MALDGGFLRAEEVSTLRYAVGWGHTKFVSGSKAETPSVTSHFPEVM
jgi:hypothetical protein